MTVMKSPQPPRIVERPRWKCKSTRFAWRRPYLKDAWAIAVGLACALGCQGDRDKVGSRRGLGTREGRNVDRLFLKPVAIRKCQHDSCAGPECSTEEKVVLAISFRGNDDNSTF